MRFERVGMPKFEACNQNYWLLGPHIWIDEIY